MHKLFDFIRLMRPHQWLKNGFVFAGLLFSQRWSDTALVVQVLLTFAAFCAVSSLVYILNDWHDRAQDALHPEKKQRPLASGAVSPHGGLVLAMLLGLTAFVLVMQHLHVQLLLLLLGIYLALNLAYTFKLKQVPVVDVFMISGGFLLRLLAGTLAVGITPSRWLLLTGLFLALFLGFSKRKSESLRAADQQRQVLQSYTPALLDVLISAALTATLTTYSLYAISPEVQALHGERLMYTVPLVVFSMFRYCFLVQQGHGEDVSKDLFKDPWILGAGLVWVLLFTGPKF